MRNSKSSIAVVIAERSRRVKGFMAHFAKCGCQQGVFIFGNRSKASVSRPVYSALKISSPNAFMCSEKSEWNRSSGLPPGTVLRHGSEAVLVDI